MALDVGSKTIGVAVSDPLGVTAQGVEVIRRRRWEQDRKRLQELVEKYEVERLLIGLPRRTTGEWGPEADKIRAFGERLEEALQLPVTYWNEWFSTRSAEQVLLEADLSRRRRREVIDQVAAAVILQHYLDSRAGKETGCSAKPDIKGEKDGLPQ